MILKILSSFIGTFSIHTFSHTILKPILQLQRFPLIPCNCMFTNFPIFLDKFLVKNSKNIHKSWKFGKITFKSNFLLSFCKSSPTLGELSQHFHAPTPLKVPSGGHTPPPQKKKSRLRYCLEGTKREGFS